MNSDQPMSPRRRMQALLAIPDSQRTEAEWDELVELEISLAPGNRLDGGSRYDAPSPAQANRQNNGGGGNKSPNRPQGAPTASKGNKKPARKPRGRGPRGPAPT